MRKRKKLIMNAMWVWGMMVPAGVGNPKVVAEPHLPPQEMLLKTPSLEETFQLLYDQFKETSRPAYEVFRRAMLGYNQLSLEGKALKPIVAVADFSLSANEKRLWVFDIKEGRLLFNTYVSHGRNTGNVFAKKFSNVPNSNMSSLGFYTTAETYFGKHGLSLRLDGQEPGFNDNARKRAVVMHGADYASPEFIKNAGRLGRSFGCPSVPMRLHKDIIEQIKEGAVLFIHYPDEHYETGSRYLKASGTALTSF